MRGQRKIERLSQNLTLSRNESIWKLTSEVDHNDRGYGDPLSRMLNSYLASKCLKLHWMRSVRIKPARLHLGLTIKRATVAWRSLEDMKMARTSGRGAIGVISLL